MKALAFNDLFRVSLQQTGLTVLRSSLCCDIDFSVASGFFRFTPATVTFEVRSAAFPDWGAPLGKGQHPFRGVLGMEHHVPLVLGVSHTPFQVHGRSVY